MSEHNIADCPKCGKRDFVLRDDGKWVCLNPDCKFTERMPKSDSTADVISAIMAAFTVAIVMMAFF